MKVESRVPPRRFPVGNGRITLRHCADVFLEDDELVTFVSRSGSQYDVTRKSWGYYATPSLNSRLAGFGLRAVLVRDDPGKLFVMLVERGSEDAFHAYLREEHHSIVAWLDSDEAVASLIRAVQRSSVSPEGESEGVE